MAWPGNVSAVFPASPAECRLASGVGEGSLHGKPDIRDSYKPAFTAGNGFSGSKQCNPVRICTMEYKRQYGCGKAYASGFILLGVCTGVFPSWNLLEQDTCCRKSDGR